MTATKRNKKARKANARPKTSPTNPGHVPPDEPTLMLEGLPVPNTTESEAPGTSAPDIGLSGAAAPPRAERAPRAPAERKPTVSSAFRDALRAGLDNKAATAQVAELFPEWAAETHPGYAAWYRNHLRKAGEQV